LLEAMLASLPVVATAVSSIPEIVRDGETGVLVPPEDPVALAEAVRRVLDDSAGYGERGRERARAEFSVAKMADRTLAVYEEALSAAS
jgi:alpha-maltose-1-phosphate synthase